MLLIYIFIACERFPAFTVMLDKSKIISYFGNLAASWDDYVKYDEAIINSILDNACVKENLKILDVACGTGVLIPFYLMRNVASVTAVDITPEMINKAKAKFGNINNVNLLCADAEKDEIGHGYDAIIVYNAFPHFSNPEKLISYLSSLLNKSGTLTVAHGESREQIDAHHAGTARDVSIGLMESEDLACIFRQFLELGTVVSNSRMYQVVGIRK